MKFLAFTVVTGLLFTVAHGQTAADVNATVNSMAGGTSMFQSFDNRAKEAKGKVLVFDEYLPGGIVMNNGQEFEFNRMNYDGYHDAIIVIRQKQEQVVTTMQVKAFYIVEYTDTLWFDRLLRVDNRMGYYQRIYMGPNVRLYKKRFISFQDATWTGAYSLGTFNAEMVNAFTYFAQEGKLRPKEFKNRKTLIELFPEHREEISDFVREHRTDFKDDVEVESLFRHINKVRPAPIDDPNTN